MAGTRGSDTEDRLKAHLTGVDHQPAGLGEHDREAAADAGLHLAGPPVGTAGIADDHARLEKAAHSGTPGRQATGAASGPDIAGLVGARIYHDLINPLGAISNGIELLGLAGQADEPVLALISQSVEAATLRLRLLRLAFGSASPGQALASAEVSDLLARCSRTGRLRIDWEAPQMVPASEVRLILLCLLCLETAMPTGGRVVVSRGTSWHMKAETGRLRDLADLWDVFTGWSKPARIDAAMLQFALAPIRAAELGASMTVLRGEGRLEILCALAGET